ncbi:hypothetical protein SAMN04487936_103374 [Halobacillus dabanensis]|uniref:Uncharacterized protein n=1 Tax=Halobacillus dabanensis TaxID=240302 RepID=A0A1I3TK14_HALDA|nr:hypothetical protein [Halobacillus dabanensis]SFJ69966.1 hypothetical protein SAMN04487936_103374 [Halobacillus dabanensis]
MSIKERNFIKKCISLLLVFTLLLSLFPVDIFDKVYSQEKMKEPAENESFDNKLDRKEVISQRSENSTTYLNMDGTYTTEISEEPIHYKEKNDEQWEPIDNSLIPTQENDGYTNRANSFQTYFSKNSNGNNQLMEIIEEDVSVSLTPVGKDHNVPSLVNNEQRKVQGNINNTSILYPNLYPNVDVEYTVSHDKVKEDIILKQKPALDDPSHFSFKLDLQGLDYKVQDDGSIILVHKNSKEPAFYLEKPFMYDSSKPEGYKENPGVVAFSEDSLSYDIEMKVHKQGDQLFIDLLPNREWLLDKKRVYPVVIDPTIGKFQPQAELDDTNIRSYFPNNTGGQKQR